MYIMKICILYILYMYYIHIIYIYWKFSKELLLFGVLCSLHLFFILPHKWDSFYGSIYHFMVTLSKILRSNSFSHRNLSEMLRIFDFQKNYIHIIYVLYTYYIHKMKSFNKFLQFGVLCSLPLFFILPHKWDSF